MIFSSGFSTDLQDNAQFVVSSLRSLAKKSSTGKVGLVAHSQGNLLAQWSLVFWPSLRSKISNFISISPDFKGVPGFVASCQQTNVTGQGCTQGETAVWTQQMSKIIDSHTSSSFSNSFDSPHTAICRSIWTRTRFPLPSSAKEARWL